MLNYEYLNINIEFLAQLTANHWWEYLVI